MVLLDSDTDNSIVIEHDKNRKLTCLKDTPLKIDSGKKTIQYSDEDEYIGTNNDEVIGTDEYSSNKGNKDCKDGEKINISTETDDSDNTNDANNEDDNDNNDDEDDDDGPDEDVMVMSRAARMSIMGVVPKDTDSNESDFIQSDDVSKILLYIYFD
jgi:hypothetical protein